MRLIYWAVGIFCSALCQPAPGKAGLQVRNTPQTQAEMHQRVETLYSFHPAKLTADERAAKSKEMDRFWNDMTGRSDVGLPMLRVELQQAKSGSYFLTDGSQLLLSLSKSIDDEQLAANTLARTDLDDTNASSYFFAIHSLALNGVDTTAAALHILDKPKFLVVVPQHAITLDRRMALMYVLLSMKDDRWILPAERRFADEHDPEAKLALVFAFSYAQTDEADAEMRKIGDDETQPEVIRKQARELLSEAQKTGKSWLPIKGTVAQIREQRKARLKVVSDEAIDDVQWMTRKIVQLRAKGKG